MITGRGSGSTAPTALLGFCLALLTIFFFRSTLPSLLPLWETPEYSYCPPLLIVAAIWGVSLYRKGRPSVRSSPAGVAVVALAVVLNVLGGLAANNWVNHYSAVVLTAGLVLALLGQPTLRTTFPAIFLLSFAIPLPPLMMATLTSQAQLLSSTLSVSVLNLLDIPVYQDGNIIDLGNYKLQVAEACSGLRYLFPFLTFGYLFAFLFEHQGWKRLVLLFSTLPITILMNVLRIVFVGITVNRWGIGMAEGVLHDFEGMGVFLLCLLMFLCVYGALSVIGPRPRSGGDVAATAAAPAPRSLRGYPRLIAALCCLMIAGLLAQHFLLPADGDRPPARQRFEDFPLRIGNWTGRTDALPLDQIEGLKLTDYLLADYRNDATQGSVNFFSAYYASQKRDAAPHSPLVCINGAGWEITTLSADYVVHDMSGRPLLHVNRVLIKRSGITDLVYFWFQERGRDLTSTTMRKWFLFRDSLFRNRTDGALMRVVTQVDDVNNLGPSDDRLSDFLRDALPALEQFVPD